MELSIFNELYSVQFVYCAVQILQAEYITVWSSFYFLFTKSNNVFVNSVYTCMYSTSSKFMEGKTVIRFSSTAAATITANQTQQKIVKWLIAFIANKHFV